MTEDTIITDSNIDAIRRAFPAVDESLKRIALLNSLLAGANSLHLEGDAYAGLEEVLYGIEDALTLAARAMTPAFNRWQAGREYAVPSNIIVSDARE